MTKVLTFKVGIEELENKIWREIEITDKRTVADLAYTILASFDSLAYHLYKIKHGKDLYDCMIDTDFIDEDVEYLNAVNTSLDKLDFSKNKKMVMRYDFGTPTVFIINFLNSRELEKYNANHYPYVVDGAGRGMLDDITGEELKEIVEDIDKKGYSEHYFTPGYERKIKYDYRDFDIKGNNILLKGLVSEIKSGYEDGE